MPIACLTSTKERLISLDYSEEEWKQLKSRYIGLGLNMQCCGAPAIPKTSKLGTQYFAHKSDACGSGKESLEHLRCKELVVKGGHAAGWKSMPEQPGADYDGNNWVADVLCQKENLKIAFEIQLASQTFDEYKYRTARYARSGVQCIWLIRRGHAHPIALQMIKDRRGHASAKHSSLHPDREDMPVFLVDISNTENIHVFFPWHHGRGPYQIPLADFVQGSLSGRMFFQDGRWCWST